MQLTKELLQHYINKVPIGYYVGRNVDVAIGDKDDTYFDLVKGSIVISYPTIKDNARLIKTDADAEKSVRHLIFHELSHALLTPRILHIDMVLNVFEDERIESILKNYYLDTDFKTFVKKLNGFKNQPPENEWDAWYQLVRYRRGPVYFLSRVHEIIDDYTHLDIAVSRIDTEIRSSIRNYEAEVNHLYEEFVKWYNQTNPSDLKIDKSLKDLMQNGEGDGQSDDKNSQQIQVGTGLSNADNNQSDNNKDGLEEALQKLLESLKDNKKDLLMEVPKVDAKANKFANVSSIEAIDVNEGDYDDLYTIIDDSNDKAGGLWHRPGKDDDKAKQKADKAVFDMIDSLISLLKTTRKNNGSSIAAYSGVINPRNVIRDDYKYFMQQNRKGHASVYSKMHLNMFIDCSASFKDNDEKVNTLLWALTKFERAVPDFSYDLISCGVGQKLRPKYNRTQSSYDGTVLTDDIFDMFKKQQFTNAVNMNIVLYDGKVNHLHKYKTTGKRIESNWEAFNDVNTVIIVDDSNEEAVNKFCPLAHKIISKDYVEELYKNTYAALLQLIRRT